VGTANVRSCAPACPPFIVALRERGPTAIHDRRPRSGRGLTGFPIRRSGDHFPNIDHLKDGLDRFTVGAPHLIHFQCIGSPLENISWRE
jgi:hypothetical protein